MAHVGAAPLVDLSIKRKGYSGDTNGVATGADAVLGLSLAIRQAEVIGLVGPSGCGKTTTLRILLGLDRDFDGCVVPDPAEVASRIMFQEPRLLPWRTVEENVRLVLPSDQMRQDLGPLFAELGLTAWRDHYPGQLSLGLARRAALARALANPPDLLVLDEPFVSLDEKAAADLSRIVVARAARDRMAVVLVTHNLREVLAVADRVVLLTPRPARVLDEIVLDRSRDERSGDWIEQQRTLLAARFAADRPEPLLSTKE